MLSSQPLEKVNQSAVLFSQYCILTLLLVTFGRRGHRRVFKRLCRPARLPLLMTWWITAELDVGGSSPRCCVEEGLIGLYASLGPKLQKVNPFSL